jgi:hypothetical protein
MQGSRRSTARGIDVHASAYIAILLHVHFMKVLWQTLELNFYRFGMLDRDSIDLDSIIYK